MKYLVPYDFSAVTKNAVNNCIHFCQKFGVKIDSHYSSPISIELNL